MKQIFPAKLDNLHGMLEFVCNAASSAGLSDKIIARVELATEEALINIIKHSYPANYSIKESDKTIEISCERLNEQKSSSSSKPESTKDGILVKITDHGIPFDPLLNSPLIPKEMSVDEMPIGGYGIFLIRNMMDNVSYKRIHHSNELTLTKVNI